MKSVFYFDDDDISNHQIVETDNKAKSNEVFFQNSPPLPSQNERILIGSFINKAPFFIHCLSSHSSALSL